MRILFVSNYYPPHEVGGYEQLCRDVAERLRRRGHQVAVLASTHRIAGRPAGQEPDVYRVLRLSPDYGSRLPAGVQFFLTRPLVERLNRGHIRRLVRSFAPHVVSIWNLEGLPFCTAYDLEEVAGGRVAYWLAGWTPAAAGPYVDYWQRTALSRARRMPKALAARPALALCRRQEERRRPAMRHVAAVSEHMRRQVVAAGTPVSQTRVIYNGVEIDQFLRPPAQRLSGPLVLLQAGRVSADKGVHTAVEALGILVREYGAGALRLCIAGSGPADYLAALQDQAARAGVAGLVEFLGWQPRQAMPALMARGHVLLLPSVHEEAFARVVLEAMAAGLAVVGTLAGGTGEVLQHETTGLAFAAGDSASLAAQIGRLLDEPDLRLRLATAGQQLVRARFTLDYMVDQMEGLLAEAAGGRPSPQALSVARRAGDSAVEP